MGLMKPAAGVTATRPTTIAVAQPTAVGLPDRAMSRKVQTTSVAAGASIVVTNASPAIGPATSALPALNPNQPNQSRPAPRSVSGTLCGRTDDDPYSRRLPTTSAATSAAIPAFTWTTVPPAKSHAPRSASQPPPHTQCASGAYTTTDHREMNITYAENRIRSTMAPEMRAAVMMQNVAWNAMYSMWGIVIGTTAPVASSPTPFRNAKDKSPSQLFPAVRAREYPTSAHSTPTNPSEM